jgi:hypothetical protein
MPDPSTPAATKAAAQTRDPTLDRALGLRSEWAPECAGRDVYFLLGPGVARAASVATYERQPGDPVYRPLQVYTLDPATRALEGATAVLQVPYEPLQPGPKGYIFEVEPGDGDKASAAVDLEDPRLLINQGLHPSPSNPQFHQQMVYAVCSSVYATFRAALGRRIAWGFDCQDAQGITRLKLRPHAREEGANAAYDRAAGAIRFGYFAAPAGPPKGRNVPGGPVFTCLSHDIIVHELAHALIDGMRSHFLLPTGPEVLGFHEGFADLIALLQHFSYTQVLESEIQKAGNRLEHASLLLGIAQAFGSAIGKEGVLRSATDDTATRRVYNADLEAHAMGSILVCAVFDAFHVVYQRKTARYLRLATQGAGHVPDGFLGTDLVRLLAEEASKLASQFLAMCVRALDYCPPVDIRLGEFLRAMITADRDLVPDDPWAYREALIDAFAGRGIYPENVLHLSEDALVWKPLPCPFPCIDKLSFAELKFAGDPASPASRTELERQACALGEVITRPENLALFGLTAPWDERLAGGRVTLPCVQFIRTSRRVGPDGQVVFDLIAEVTQTRFVHDSITGAESAFTGGATIILGPNGECRYVVMKSILNRRRLEEQLAFQRTRLSRCIGEILYASPAVLVTGVVVDPGGHVPRRR